MVGFTIIIRFPSDVPRFKAYVQLSGFIFRRGAAPHLLRAFRLLGIVRVFKHRIGGSPFFPATYIFSYYTGGREKYSAQKFRVPFVRSTLPVILSSRVSSFLSCQIHAHVRTYIYIWCTITCACCSTRMYNGEQIVRRKVVFSAVVGTISYKRNKRNISNGESPRWRKWMEPFLGKCNYHWLYVRSSNIFEYGYEERRGKRMPFSPLWIFLMQQFKFPLNLLSANYNVIISWKITRIN